MLDTFLRVSTKYSIYFWAESNAMSPAAPETSLASGMCRPADRIGPIAVYY